jgi:hypothetical protein
MNIHWQYIDHIEYIEIAVSVDASSQRETASWYNYGNNRCPVAI